MADVASYVKQIREAVYGEEVRGSICDAILAMNEESSKAIQDSSNAKDSAKASAAQAGDSAKAAKTSETNAGNSAKAAKTSETNAGNSATAAKQSETNAGDSATAAGTSAQNAAGSASAASGSATAAGQSATAAANSANTAQQQATAAGKSAEASQKSADNSAASANTANRNATNAGNSAAAAKQSETNAGNSANAARNSAAAAAESEDAAHGYALLASSFQLNLNYTAEELEKYIFLLGTIERALSGLEYTEHLLDSSGSTILDSMGCPIVTVEVGFEGLMYLIQSLQRQQNENRTRIDECFEEIAKLKNSMLHVPIVEAIKDFSGEDITDSSGAVIQGVNIYTTM